MNFNRILLKHNDMNFLRLSISNLNLESFYFELISQSLISFKNLEHLELFFGGNKNIDNQLASEIFYNIGLIKSLSYLEIDFGYTSINYELFFFNQQFGKKLKNLRHLYLHLNGIEINLNFYTNFLMFIENLNNLEAIKIKIKDFKSDNEEIIILLKETLKEYIDTVKIIY